MKTWTYLRRGIEPETGQEDKEPDVPERLWNFDDLENFCPEPRREGKHEVYLKDSVSFCRACGEVLS